MDLEKSETVIKEDILNALNIEISIIDSKSAKNGWSLWVLMAALASVSWLLLTVKDLPKAVPHEVVYYTICIALLVDIFCGVCPESGNKEVKEGKKEARFRFVNFLKYRNLYFYYCILRCTVVLFGLWYVWYVTRITVPLMAVLFYCEMLLIWVSILVIISIDDCAIATKYDSLEKDNSFLFGLLYICIPIGAFMQYAVMDFGFENPFLAFKIAVLVSTLIEILRLISSHNQIPPLYYSLLDIRRNLLLGAISPEVAKKKIELALYGLSLNDVFQKDLIDLLELGRRCANEVRSGQVKILKLLKEGKAIEVDYLGLPVAEIDMSQLRGRYNDLENEVKSSEIKETGYRIRDNVIAYKNRHEKFKVKMNIFMMLNKEHVNGVSHIMDQIEANFREYDELFSQFNNYSKQLMLTISSIELILGGGEK